MSLHQILFWTLVATIGIDQVKADWNNDVYDVLKKRFDTFIQTYQNILSTHIGNDQIQYNTYNNWKNAVNDYLSETNFCDITKWYINEITGYFRPSNVTDDTKTQIKKALETLCKKINSDKHKYMKEFQYRKLPLLHYLAGTYTRTFGITDPPFANICPSIDPKSNIKKNSIKKRSQPSSQIEPLPYDE